MSRPTGTLVRNTTLARINHWITAGCFVLLLISGLSMFHPMLFFLSQIRSEERRVGKECSS